MDMTVNLKNEEGVQNFVQQHPQMAPANRDAPLPPLPSVGLAVLPLLLNAVLRERDGRSCFPLRKGS